MQPESPTHSQRTAVNPNMIVLGRESRGLLQKELAQQLGVTQGRLSKIEADLLPVPDDLLTKLSHVLHYPEHFFRQEGTILGLGIAEVYHRKQQAVSKRLLDQGYARIDLHIKRIATLLRAVDISCDVPQLDADEYGGRVEEIARVVRAGWHLPRGPVQDVTQTLEDAGVIVVPLDFQTRQVDAISRWVPNLPPVVFVNKDAPKDRWRLSLMHDLGHLVMHALPNPEIEKQAFRFAAEFLMPEREVRADLTDLTLPKLAVLKRYWKVSMNALLKRAEELGTISANQARYLWAQMGAAGYRLREPVELDIGGEQPRLLHEIIDAHRKDLGYSVPDLGKLLALFEDELLALYVENPSQPRLRALPAKPNDMTS